VEFSSYDEMVKFEAERERFYLDFIGICDSFDPLRIKFYKRLFLETFHPKYRRQKKLYDIMVAGGVIATATRVQIQFSLLIPILYLTGKSVSSATIDVSTRFM